jgi:hypothetical protein
MYEVVEAAGEWIVRCAGREMGRYEAQATALQALADHIRQETPSEGPISFAMRFQSRLG